MITVRCSTLSLYYRGPRYLLVPACRIVIVLAVVVLAMVLVVRGYSPESITGPVLVLMGGAIAVAERFNGVQGVQAVAPTPSL